MTAATKTADPAAPLADHQAADGPRAGVTVVDGKVQAHVPLRVIVQWGGWILLGLAVVGGLGGGGYMLGGGGKAGDLQIQVTEIEDRLDRLEPITTRLETVTTRLEMVERRSLRNQAIAIGAYRHLHSTIVSGINHLASGNKAKWEQPTQQPELMTAINDAEHEQETIRQRALQRASHE